MLVVYSGGPLDISWAKENDNVTAILQSFFPAQSAGSALAMVLTGKYNPAGRLPNTWPASLDQVRGSVIPNPSILWNWTMLMAATYNIMWILFHILTPHTYVHMHSLSLFLSLSLSHTHIHMHTHTHTHTHTCTYVHMMNTPPLQVPDITNYTMVNRTYRYFQGEPLYPFGYGLYVLTMHKLPLMSQL